MPLETLRLPAGTLLRPGFVFAIGRLAEHLHGELSWRGAAETVVILVAVLSTWALTSFDAIFLDVHRPRTRWLVLSVMGLGLGLGLFMNTQISPMPSESGHGPSWSRWR